IVAAVIMLTTGWYYADPILSAGIGLFILPRIWILLKDAINILLEGTPKDIDINKLKESLLQIDKVKDLHDLHVWTLTSGINALSAHVVVETSASFPDMLKKVQDHILSNYKIAHTTIQLEKAGHEEEKTAF